MSSVYSPHEVERAAQDYWNAHRCFESREDPLKKKYYCLSMLPYPSGHLHMGHVRNYTLGDVFARYHHMLGYNVLHPMGWDAFGLPAENAALKNGSPPAAWTYRNIEHMRAQLDRMGFSFDWSREVTTCSPDYYRWEQWLFIQMYNKGLAYRATAQVNWDPVDQTVLANEQVVNGRGWRSGALVEQRSISQWFLKITDYAEELLSDLDTLDWPEEVRLMQKHWIGRSEGATIPFALEGDRSVDVYTTRPDTLMGVTYLALSFEHPYVLSQAEQDTSLMTFIEECRKTPVSEAAQSVIEKRGFKLAFVAKHPLSGEDIPVWAANFVLMHYGTGAVMGVPAHDPRDHAFALQYQLPIVPVLDPEGMAWNFDQEAYTEPGLMRFFKETEELAGLPSPEAAKRLITKLSERGLAQSSVRYRLRDWGVSRQRYWGAPIPMIHCERCGIVPVPLEELPVRLPEEVVLSGLTSPLQSDPSFYSCICPSCGQSARRETDTFDTFIESSWYYARYTCSDQDAAMLDPRAHYWMPVDQYIGGIEHAVMHLLYARFFYKVLRDLGLVFDDEPFSRLLTQGMVLKDGAKMSKSKGNVVDPDPLIEQYGADTVRTFMMFAAPPSLSLEWSDQGVEGSFRFLNRVWQLAMRHLQSPSSASHEGACGEAPFAEHRRSLHQILKQARHDYERGQFNTVVSACMKIQNLLNLPELESSKAWSLRQEGLSILLRLLSPIAPHLAHVLWQKLGFGENILQAPFPEEDPSALLSDTLILSVQVNGKMRGRLEISSSASEEEIVQAAWALPSVQAQTEGKTLQRSIWVPGRLINLMVS